MVGLYIEIFKTSIFFQITWPSVSNLNAIIGA